MKKFYYPIVCVTLLLVTISSCINRSSLSPSERKQLMEEVRSYREELPIELAGKEMMITDIELEGDIFTYTCSVDPILLASADYLNSDKSLARIVSMLDNDIVSFLVEKHMGIKYKYVNSITDELIHEINIEPSKLKEIFEKLNSGEIEQYTLLDVTRLELENLDLPIQLNDEVMWTKAYTGIKNVYYEYELVNVDDLDDYYDDILDDLAEATKYELIEEIRQMELIQFNKKEIIDEDMHFIYTYTNNKGKTLYTIDVSPNDIFRIY